MFHVEYMNGKSWTTYSYEENEGCAKSAIVYAQKHEHYAERTFRIRGPKSAAK